MKNSRKPLVVFAAVIMGMNLNQAESSLHRVGGGKYTWKPNVNLSEWASHEHFNVGDWLYFGFDKTKYSVLQVNQTSYENCVERDFIANVTRGGRDVFQLTDAKRYYFISGRGYCFKGMKVAIYAHEQTPSLPISSPSPPSKSGVSMATGVSAAMLVSRLVWAWLVTCN